jgi:uridine kinase
MMDGVQRICVHGEGGCGKTTALQEIEALLPNGSVIIVFDCYGNGGYINTDSYRHRAPDAFLQLSNDLASQLRIPLLLSPSRNIDYPRVFKKSSL